MRFLHAALNFWFFGTFVFLLFWSVGLVLTDRLSRRIAVPAGFRLVTALLLNGLLGYLVFWIYFLHRYPGIAISLAILTVGIAQWRRRLRNVLLASLTGWEKQALLVCFVAANSAQLVNLHFNYTDSGLENSAQRVLGPMPHDNRIPAMFAAHLFRGSDPRDMGAGWQSSDRPPLQTGLHLAFGLIAEPIRTGPQVYQVIAVLLQSLWVIPLFFFFSPEFQSANRLGSPSSGWEWNGANLATQVALAASLSGFVFFNTIYVWPKLLGASLGLMGCLLLLVEPKTRSVWWGSAVAFALAYLSHGGAGFGFLAVALVWPALGDWRPRRGFWEAAGIGAGLLGLWLAYQKLYDPPGDRLFRMHLAEDQLDISLGQAIAESYGKLTWESWKRTKLWNWNFMYPRVAWFALPWEVTRATAAEYRVDAFLRLFATPGIFGLGAVAVFLRRPRPRNAQILFRFLVLSAAYTAIGIAIWNLVLFNPSGTCIHCGYYGFPLVMILVPAAATALTGPRFYWPMVSLHGASFFLMWVVFSPTQREPAQWIFLGVNILLMGLAYWKLHDHSPQS